jgi:hypothetical protein
MDMPYSNEDKVIAGVILISNAAPCIVITSEICSFVIDQQESQF